MAVCGTCRHEIQGRAQKKVDRIVSGVSLRQLLEEYFNFEPHVPIVCGKCDQSLEKIAKVNVKLEKLISQRNCLIDDFRERLGLGDGQSVFSLVESETTDSSGGQAWTRRNSRESQITHAGPHILPGAKEDSHTDKHNAAKDRNSNTSSTETAVIMHMQESGPEENRNWDTSLCVPDIRLAVLADNSCDQDKTQSQTQSTKSRPTTRDRQPQTKRLPSPATSTDENDDDADVGHSDIPSVRSVSNPGSECLANGQITHKAEEYRNNCIKLKGTKLYVCGVCYKSFTQASLLSKHMYIHKKMRKWVTCGKCQKTFRNSSILDTHIRKSHTAIDRHCEVCSETFTDLVLFRAHMKAHRERDERVYRCKRCPRTFLNILDLNKHRRDSHDQPKVYLCQWCSKTFTNSSSFGYHCRIHTGEKPHKCQFCPAAFKEASKLKNHMNMHSGEKPYKCDKCPQSFPYPSGLHTHLKIHSGEKPYKCDQCSRAFVIPLGLRNHKNSAHSDVRPYVCEVCCSAFKLQSHLKRHSILHSGVKPFKCDKCPATFTQKGNMKIHMKVHNKDKQKSEILLSKDRTASEINCVPSEHLQIPPASNVDSVTASLSPPQQLVMDTVPWTVTQHPD